MRSGRVYAAACRAAVPPRWPAVLGNAQQPGPALELHRDAAQLLGQTLRVVILLPPHASPHNSQCFFGRDCLRGLLVWGVGRQRRKRFEISFHCLKIRRQWKSKCRQYIYAAGAEKKRKGKAVGGDVEKLLFLLLLTQDEMKYTTSWRCVALCHPSRHSTLSLRTCRWNCWSPLRPSASPKLCL